MNLLSSITIKDLSGGDRYQNFLSQLPLFHTAIGYFDTYDPEPLNRVLAEVKLYLETHPGDRKFRKRVYSLAVECFDNIRNYYSNRRDRFEGALLSFTEEGEHFCITAGNQISREDEHHLRSRLELLSKLPSDELGQEFLETIVLPNHRKENGAGLGLIMMGKREGSFVDHHFEEINEDHSFFYIRIKIST